MSYFHRQMMMNVQRAAAAAAAAVNNIGVPGELGFGVGIYPGPLPSGFSEMTGTRIKGHDNYGNYQYSDGSVMVWRPAFYYRIGHPENPTFATFGVNSVDIKPERAFSSRESAALSGYALHRAFINGGSQVRGFMLDKYQCSNNGGIASSLKNGNPLSSNSAHNPFSSLTGLTTSHNFYFGAIDAAKTRGPQFHCSSRFQFITGAMISLAHGQRATLETCAWYDASGVMNFPKGNTANTNPPRDVNDASVVYTASGYLNFGKTGSAGLFAKTTDNGQMCGVADLNGNMWEINTGMVRDSGNAAFYILKESANANTLSSGSNNGATGSLAAWGDAAHLVTLYDIIPLAHISNANAWLRFGNGANQVLSEASDGNNWRMTGAGIYLPTGKSVGGTTQFGNDGLYEVFVANLCLISGGSWGSTSSAGAWALYLNYHRTRSVADVGLRSSAYV